MVELMTERDYLGELYGLSIYVESRVDMSISDYKAARNKIQQQLISILPKFINYDAE
jgi:hypothetical protein